MTDDEFDISDQVGSDFNDVPEVHGLALSFWCEQQIREPKKWWHPLRRAWDVIKYAITVPQRR
ncbi:hypothetical protein [Mycobacterium avium]|uniref:hypothetical protein n=1 Tax=Mycobacterium avium TaxID=1764 RepID=UPI001CC3A938|nr:hypothetical protein [Mycobacterium avium]MBZ4514589.1 hypothetical protein [Mycobacterium avium subsp. hominissuis]MBZ4524130.1 hypothetical protein [Mycobacterium avium subsp. hominissuis]MBZ4543900.1 hypothetical protein [Mycobacterium avium subsp. hominissuis]MBZ4553020.1 hypothetical protein [Mycobacterium avium subsp. hominissuis]MBZ4562533.1 hypothetical protein [Mycobacterium avium subsp. hominissuis]